MFNPYFLRFALASSLLKPVGEAFKASKTSFMGMEAAFSNTIPPKLQKILKLENVVPGVRLRSCCEKLQEVVFLQWNNFMIHWYPRLLILVSQ
jgi:hypothetical protein